jgi:hypothetical protein
VAEIAAQQKVAAGNRFQPVGATIAASSSAPNSFQFSKR